MTRFRFALLLPALLVMSAQAPALAQNATPVTSLPSPERPRLQPPRC